MRDGMPDRVPLAEYYTDYEAIVKLLGEKSVPESRFNKREQQEHICRQNIKFYETFGMDFVRASIGWQAPKNYSRIEATDSLLGKRTWVSEQDGPIACHEDLERYPWNMAGNVDYHMLEFISKNLPDGMKIICDTDGPFETVRELMGFEKFAVAIIENPDLVAELFNRVGNILLTIHRNIVAMDNIGAVHMGDDMCYKQGPMISPAMLRKYVFPWHKKIVENAHAKDLPFTLHSDGNNDIIMDDLISYVGIDGKHAFEDAAQPVEEVKRKYGNRVSLIGGMDVDFFCRSDENTLRKRVRTMIETCGAGGGYAFGMGSCLATFMPLDKYVMMLNEALDVIGG